MCVVAEWKAVFEQNKEWEDRKGVNSSLCHSPETEICNSSGAFVWEGGLEVESALQGVLAELLSCSALVLVTVMFVLCSPRAGL